VADVGHITQGRNGLYTQLNRYETMGEEASILRQGVGGARAGRMKEITVHIPEPYLQVIDELVRRKYYLSRADVIRTALHDLIMKERINLTSDQIEGS
jgi:hypothetical protein